MNPSERASLAKALHDRPLDTIDTPPGQAFAIGQKVRLIADYGWGYLPVDVLEIEYSHSQKYGWMSSEGGDPKKYSCTGSRGSVAWLEERWLIAVPEAGN